MSWLGSPPAPDQPILGRHAECEAIDRLLAAVRDGFSGVLVLVGEAGIGKTRLLDHAAASAEDLRVLRLVGVESERHLAFGALHRLLLPFRDRLDLLPGRQRDALRWAFGLAVGSPSDRTLVGLAALTALSGAAADWPLVCLVDDVHWLDRESVEALAFVARRLHADSLGMVFAAREGISRLGLFETLRVLRVGGLSATDARALLDRGVAGHLDRTVADRIVTGTGGNPLALLELANRLAIEQLAGLAPLPDPLPVSRLLEDHFRRSVAILPGDTRTLLLLMAATPTDDTRTMWRAAAVLGLSALPARPAVAAGILERGAGAGFRHPLIRSAVYAAASDEERRRVHAALAVASAPDRRAWHLAEATPGADDEVAAELEAASERARSRGGHSEQALFLSRAADMTTRPALRADRYLAAAVAHLTSGDLTAAQTMVDLAVPDLSGPVARARAIRIRASVEMFHIRVDRVPAMMLDAMAELGPADPSMTWELLYEATHAALMARDRIQGTTLTEIAKVAAEAWHDPDAPTANPDLLMEGMAHRAAYGYAQGVPILRAALSRLRATGELQERNTPFSVIVSLAADELWDATSRGEIIGRLAALDRSQGALYGLSLCLVIMATGELCEGRFAAAETLYAEVDDYSAATGFPGSGKINRALLYAWTGQEQELRAAVAVIDGLVEACGIGSLAHVAAQAQCILDLGRGRYREALDHALPPFSEDSISVGNLVTPLLIEAAVRVGDRRTAAAALTRIEERAPLAGTPWALGILARCRALMAEDDTAEELYRESIELLGQVPMAVEKAWSQLLFGEWLRRRKRRSDARVPLRAAYESFDSWGAAPLAERARTELLATGETTRKRTVRTRFDLTPQERQVAGLAAAGLTNAEIATRLFVTTSTIEFHLNKVFRKLGITSRRQIARALDETRR